MSKDVIYIEPEEDITDIISKIESSKSRIVALVPPKKAGVFKSIVNIKLITKAAASADKAVVLVTTDDSIVKLAATTRLPVTKDLNTAPAVPTVDDKIDNTEVVSVEEDGREVKEKTEADKDEKADEASSDDDSKNDADKDDTEKDSKEDEEESEGDDDSDDDSSDSDSEEPEDSAKDKKAKKGFFAKLAASDNKFLRWIGTHPKVTIGCGIGLIALIIFCIWAFAIVPAVTITLELETTKGNFSEAVTFTQNLAEESISEGKFYIEEKKAESKAEVEFEATGKKNVGEKASGTIKVTHYFPLSSKGGTVAINNGATFTNSGLTYTVTNGSQISWDGDVTAAEKDCNNYTKGDNSWKDYGCAVSTTVTVTATESGTKYNISGTSSGWSSSVSGLDVIANNAMSGGSDKNVTIVQQSDIDEAMKKISSESGSASKDKLLATVSEGQFPIDSSFKQTTSDPVSSPKVGEEVEDGKKAKLTVTTTDTIFVLDEEKLKEFISEKAKLQEGYKIYEMNDPFIENFSKTESGYIGKLKTVYVAGSTITENEVVDTVKGKGIGTAKRDLADDFKGIKTITIDTSAPWVSSVPNNPEKITVKINTKE